MIRRSILLLVPFFVLISCSKSLPSHRNALRFTTQACWGKSILENATALPGSYTIYASSFFVSHTDGLGNGNYFVGMPFRRDDTSGTWGADPMVYWPAGGNLNFLCIACEDDFLDVQKSVHWSEPDCTTGVEMDIADGTMLNSELLYTNAVTRTRDKGSVNLEFKHSQSWLQFRVRCTRQDLMKIDSIIVYKAYSGGRFTVRNDVFASGEWSFRGHYRKDVKVPQAQGTVPMDGYSVFNILLPEQEASGFEIHYRLRQGNGDWDDSRPECYRSEPIIDCWYYGTRYVYDITASFTGISLDIHTEDWIGDNQEININP